MAVQAKQCGTLNLAATRHFQRNKNIPFRAYFVSGNQMEIQRLFWIQKKVIATDNEKLLCCEKY